MDVEGKATSNTTKIQSASEEDQNSVDYKEFGKIKLTENQQQQQKPSNSFSPSISVLVQY